MLRQHLRISTFEYRRFLELLQKPHIVPPEVTDVVDLVAQHELAFRTHAPGVARIDPRVVTAILQHVRVHHAAAEDLEPAGVLAYLAAGAAAYEAFHIHFGGWFRER